MNDDERHERYERHERHERHEQREQREGDTRTVLREVFEGWVKDAPDTPERATIEQRVRATIEPRGRTTIEPRVRAADAAKTASAVDERSSVPRRPGRSTRWIRVVASLAVAAAIVSAFVFTGGGNRPLGPRAALVRAAERYLAARDAELRVKVDLPAIRSLMKMFDAKGEPPEAKYFELFVQSPYRFIFKEIDGPAGQWHEGLEIHGFNGQRAWEYDPKGGVVNVSPGNPLDDEEGLPEDFDLMQYLSFDYATELQDEEKYRVTELTGPADERVGRRVVRIETRPEEASDFRATWSESVVHIDARSGQIQKAVVDAELLGASVIRFEVHLVATDLGLGDEFFEWSRHVPAGVPVETLDEGGEGDDGNGGADGDRGADGDDRR